MKVISLRECCQQDGLSVDSEAPILRNVKILGLDSKNRRRYTLEAAQGAVSQYELSKVNIDHPDRKTPHAPRGLRDRFGRLVNITVTGDGVYGDLEYNPHHPLAEAVLWWAKNQPDALGLSHNAQGKGQTGGDGITTISEILNVRSVDLVADPATTQSLYEDHMDPAMMEPDAVADSVPDEGGEGWEAYLGKLVATVLKDGTMSTADKRKKILHCLKLMDDGGSSKVAESEPAEPEPVDDDDDEPKDADEHVQDKSDPRLRELQEELDRYKAREKVQQRKAKARALCLEADLHPDLVTSVFLEQVARASTEQQMKALIEDRRVLSGRKPVSRGPGGGKKKVTLDEFCEELGVA